MKAIFVALVVVTSASLSLFADDLKTDFDGLMHYGLSKGRLIVQKQRSLSEAQDQFGSSLSILNSSIGLNANLSNSPSSGPQAVQNESSKIAESVSLNVKPLDVWSISAKASSDGSLTASTALSPFAGTNKSQGAARNLADAQFDFARIENLFQKGYVASYSKWSASFIEREIRVKERENALVLRDQAKAKFDLGTLTKLTYQKAENDLVQAKKNELTAITAERNNRISLLLDIGITEKVGLNIEPVLMMDQDLIDRIKSVIESNQGPKPSDNYLSAKRAFDRAAEDEKTFLAYFSGLSLEAQISSNSQTPNSKPNWSIGIGLNVSGTDIAGTSIRDSQRAKERAEESLKEAALLDSILSDSKKQDLSLQLSYLESTALTYEQAQASLLGDRVKLENGTISKVDFAGQEIEVLKAKSNYYQAYFDLYLTYLDF